MSISSVIIVIIVIEDSVIQWGEGSMNSLGGSLQLPLVGE